MTGPILLRYLWRSWRGYGAFVIMSFVAPLLVYVVARELDIYSATRVLLELSVRVWLVITVTNLGIASPLVKVKSDTAFRRRRTETERDIPLAGLPENGLAKWIAGLIVPLIIVTASGWWTGLLTGQLATDHREGVLILEWAAAAAKITFWGFLLTYTIGIMAGFVAAGIPWLFFMIYLMGNLNPVGNQNLEQLFIGAEILYVAAGGLLATYLYQVALVRWEAPRRALVSLLVAVVFIGGPWWDLPRDMVRDFDMGGKSFTPMSGVVHSSDRSVTCSTVQGIASELPGTHLELRDWRADSTRTIFLEGRALPVAVIGRDSAVIRQQKVGENQVRILLWSPDGVSEKVILPGTKRLAFGVQYFIRGFASPDGMYVVLEMHPSANGQADIWLVDMLGKEARILIPNTRQALRCATWDMDRLYISGNDLLAKVSLPSMRVTQLDVQKDSRQ